MPVTSALTGIKPIYYTGQQAGGSPSSYTREYGGIPNLPAYTTDTSQTIGTDVYSQLTANLPGYQAMVGKSSENIGENLEGIVPKDVIDLMTQQAAERGIATGAPGSPNANAAYLRALGLTSMGLQQLGEQQLTAAVGRTPLQQTQVGTQTSDLAAARAQYAAAPDPRAAALESLATAKQGIRAGIGGVGGAPSGGGESPSAAWARMNQPVSEMPGIFPSYGVSNIGLSAYEPSVSGAYLPPGITYGAGLSPAGAGSGLGLGDGFDEWLNEVMGESYHQYEPEPTSFELPNIHQYEPETVAPEDASFDAWVNEVIGNY